MDLIEMYTWCTFDSAYAVFPSPGLNALKRPVFITIKGGDYYTLSLDLANRGYGPYTLEAYGKPDIILGDD